MASPCGNPAGREAATVPWQHRACGCEGLHRQNWGPFTKRTWRKSGRLGRDWGSDTAPFSTSSWSDPKPGCPLYSLVLGKTLGAWGERDKAGHTGGAVAPTRLPRWCRHDRRNKL